MDREFNLIDEPWICVRDNGCKVKEISIRQVFEHAQDYTELAGETKTQDMAVLRFLLAMIYTVFSRYDKNGDEVDPEDDINYLTDNWNEVFRSGKFPMKPFEKYFEKWYDRFWLFDEEYPFYQSLSVLKQIKENNWEKEKFRDNTKLIGTMIKSGNKPLLFCNRSGDNSILTYSEAARWILHSVLFDDRAIKASKYDFEKNKSNNNDSSNVTIGCNLGMISLKGENLFKTLMMNYVADIDDISEIMEKPAWEREKENIGLYEFKRQIPVPDNQAEMLTVMSRNIYLIRNDSAVIGCYIFAGDYFDQNDTFNELMTLWKTSKKNGKEIIEPCLHDASAKSWQEFGMIAKCCESDNNNERFPGVVNWAEKLIYKNYLDAKSLLTISCTGIVYDYNDKKSLKVLDMISDELSFHSDLLMEVGEAWRYRIGNEIGKCESAAKAVNKLSINLQKSAGASGDKLSGEDAKTQFYSMIDKPFRDWLSQLDTGYDIDEYTGEIEDTVRKIAIVFGNDCVHQMSANTIFGRYEKDGKDKNLVTTVEALNIFNATINKIFRKEGDNK